MINHQTIIALDMDGVLNSHEYFKATYNERHNKEIEELYPEDGYWLSMIDPEKVSLLNQIIEATGAVVVISSSWRITNSYSDMQRLLDQKGFIGKIIGATPKTYQLEDGSWSCRGDEIQHWLDSVTNASIAKELKFVILDDNSDMGHLKERLILTTWQQGLLKEHVDRAIAMLLS